VRALAAGRTPRDQKTEEHEATGSGRGASPTGISVLIADNFFSRLRGLIGYSPLEPATVLWIKPCQQVHTHFVRWPLQVVFVDREMQVVRVIRELRPWSISPRVRKHALRSRVCERSGLDGGEGRSTEDPQGEAKASPLASTASTARSKRPPHRGRRASHSSPIW
jgi:uncharacterized membrane protein (UPF0127 family)